MNNKKQIGEVKMHQDINSNVFKTHDGPVEKCLECQKHPKLIAWNKLLNSIDK